MRPLGRPQVHPSKTSLLEWMLDPRDLSYNFGQKAWHCLKPHRASRPSVVVCHTQTSLLIDISEISHIGGLCLSQTNLAHATTALTPPSKAAFPRSSEQFPRSPRLISVRRLLLNAHPTRHGHSCKRPSFVSISDFRSQLMKRTPSCQRYLEMTRHRRSLMGCSGTSVSIRSMTWMVSRR